MQFHTPANPPGYHDTSPAERYKTYRIYEKSLA